MDSGPEFLLVALTARAEEHGAKLESIQTALPIKTSCIESFSGNYHDEVLDLYLPMALNQAPENIHHWMPKYDEKRRKDAS